MTPSPFDPYLAQRRYLWRNRLARWRQAPGETVFHAAIVSALAIMALFFLAGRRDLSEGLLALTRASPGAWLLAWGGLIAMQLRLRLHHWQARDAGGWLAAQPIAVRVQARERGRVVLCGIWPHALAGALLFGLMALPWAAWLWLVLMLALASVAGVLWAKGFPLHAVSPMKPQTDDTRAAPRHPAHGRLWRWQAREALAGFGPRALRHGLWMLLLIPVGASALAAGIALATGLSLAAYLAAWQRSLGVLLHAERWLGAQPASARFWCSGLLVPVAQAAGGASATGLALAASGAVHVAPWVGFSLFALALLQALCTLAMRRTPSRIALAFTLQVTLLGALWQMFAPLVALLWLALCLRLLFRGLRP